MEKRRPVFVIGPSIAYIPLTRGLFGLIDREDADILSQWNWRAVKSNNRILAARKHISMHRFLLPGKVTVDHRNGNPLDNRKANLREATHRQQCWNRVRKLNHKIGLKGVSRSGSRFQARITHNGKLKTLGTFDTAELAHAAYISSALHFFGEYMRV